MASFDQSAKIANANLSKSRQAITDANENLTKADSLLAAGNKSAAQTTYEKAVGQTETGINANADARSAIGEMRTNATNPGQLKLVGEYQNQANTNDTAINATITRIDNTPLKVSVNAGGDGTDSSGTIAKDATQARDDAANTQNPPPRSEVLAPEGRIQAPPATVPSNAEVNVSPTNEGLNAPVRTTANTQATSNGTAGAGAPSEDAANGPADGSAAANATQAAINKRFGGTITPQSNVLDKYASYTYSISIYLMSPSDYTRLITNKKKYIAGFQLLMQSAGAPNYTGITPETNLNQSGAAPANAPSDQAGRNQFFPQDFYIDTLRMKSYISGKGSRGSHSVTEMSFKIVEPYGITLFERLYNAVQQYVTAENGGNGDGPMNYAAQNYLMVIRFYGYDQNGNLLPPTAITDPEGLTDKNAISEKFIPFRFTGIKFRIANRLTEYECSAVSIQNDIGTSQGRGVIPYNIELTATTLQELLGGNLTQQPQPNKPPAKANAAPQPVIITGLVSALNKFQKELVDKEQITYADEYDIVIVEPELQNAKLRPPGTADKGSWGMIEPQTAAQAKDGKKQTANTNSKNISATAGMPIVQFLDLCVRNSTYIYDQQSKIRDPESGEMIPQGSAVTPAWFKISVQSVPIEGKYDPKRNDYAYKTTYQISMYRVAQIVSDYFPEGKFYGTHKKYDYWYTGENNAILRYEQDFNYLYYLTVNTEQSVQDYGSTTNYREYIKKVYSPNSPESSQGNKNDVSEPGANASDYLYSPGDQAEVRMEIVGDPAWIQQGELWYGAEGPDVEDPSQVAFLKDGTINYTSQEVLFEVAFNKPSDYNTNTGLIDTKRNQ
jgi:hypothetical protein